MTIAEIQELIRRDETRTLELKKTTGELKDAMRTACAFLNTDGGFIIFGIAPVSLKVLGQDVTDATRREIAQALSGIEPAIDIKPEYVDVPESNGKQLIVLHFDRWNLG
ncbi:MAG TPA: ATP-dependent DNA helicase RecG, partial [Rikenellaceae bacterium]|nr:ATP-dependent DNA helicase RecG [Rikenellaceae bacterium]